MSRSNFVTIHVDPNDAHYKFSKGIVISTRQVGSKKTATAEVVYYLEKFTHERVWVPVLMSTGNPQDLVEHIKQAYKAVAPKTDSTSIVDQINGSVDDLEEKLKEIMGDLEKVETGTEETPAWKSQYDDLKKQIEELKKDTKEIQNITPETVQEYEVMSEDKSKQPKPKK